MTKNMPLATAADHQKAELPRVSVDDAGVIRLDQGRPRDAVLEKMEQITGTAHAELSEQILIETARAFPEFAKDPETAFRRAMQALAEIGPQDGLEAMLTTQMITCHNLAVILTQRAINPGAEFPYTESCLNMSIKLMRTFAAQVEALKSYRSKGEQKITIQRVDVNEGGQAIVGAVHQGGGGKN